MCPLPKVSVREAKTRRRRTFRLAAVTLTVALGAVLVLAHAVTMTVVR